MSSPTSVPPRHTFLQVRESGPAALAAVVAELREVAGRIGDERLRAEILEGCERFGADPVDLPAARPTPRELDVLALAAAGCRNRDIAALLGTSTDAVKSHLRKAMRRFGVRTRHAAVSAARARGHLP
jgi:DNA-binding CsgD family transcriptional regulator